MISRNSLDLLHVRAQRHGGRTAVIDAQGTFTYRDLLDASSRVATTLLAGREDLHEDRVAFLVTPGFPWVAVQWGIWRAGGIAVPLPLNSTKPELEYLVDDTAASTLLFDAPAASQLGPIAAARGIRALPYEHLLAFQAAGLPEVTWERRAMILYTSGTTSRPKGVVTTNANIAAQIISLVKAWEWSDSVVRVATLLWGKRCIVAWPAWRGCRNMRANSYIQGLSWIVLRATRQRTTVRIRTAIPNTSNERTLHFFTKIITHRFFRIVVSKNHARMYFCAVVKL